MGGGIGDIAATDNRPHHLVHRRSCRFQVSDRSAVAQHHDPVGLTARTSFSRCEIKITKIPSDFSRCPNAGVTQMVAASASAPVIRMTVFIRTVVDSSGFWFVLRSASFEPIRFDIGQQGVLPIFFPQPRAIARWTDGFTHHQPTLFEARLR